MTTLNVNNTHIQVSHFLDSLCFFKFQIDMVHIMSLILNIIIYYSGLIIIFYVHVYKEKS